MRRHMVGTGNDSQSIALLPGICNIAFGSDSGRLFLLPEILLVGQRSSRCLVAVAITLEDLDQLIGDPPINRDWNLKLQYLAGENFLRYQGVDLFQAIISHRGVANDLFSGPPELMEEFTRWTEEAIDRSVGSQAG